MPDRLHVIANWLGEQFNANGNFMHGPEDIWLLASDLNQRLRPGPSTELWGVEVTFDPTVPEGTIRIVPRA